MPNNPLNVATAARIETSRHTSPYSIREQSWRILWEACQASVFRYSPRQLWRFRVMLLRLFGANIGNDVRVFNTAKIFFPWQLSIGDHSAIGDGARVYNLGPITIGNYVTISQYSHLCAGTHDYTTRDMRLIRASIVIEDDVWICAEAFVGPDVVVRQGAILGARAVATKNVDSWTISVGNPAVVVKKRILDPIKPAKD